MAKIGSRPFSFAFYGFVTFASILFTLIILTIGGAIKAFDAGHIISWIVLKASGPLLLAVFLKIVFLDFCLGLKTYYLIRAVAKDYTSAKTRGRPKRAITASIFAIVCDLLLSGLITALFLNLLEAFQQTHISEKAMQSVAPASFARFFDTLNSMVTESIENAFYVLNGSLLMYGCWLFSSAADGAIAHLNVDDFKKNIFKITAALCSLLILVIVAARQLV